MKKKEFEQAINQNGDTKKSAAGSRQKSLTAFMLVAITLLAGGLVYVGTLNRSLGSARAEGNAIENPSNIIKKIGKFIELPRDEQPTVARINDVEVLKQTNPDFYAAAKNGDVLVVYTETALIYRDTTDKIIKVAPVIIHGDGTSAAPASQSESTAPVN